ncbi:MAG TPA: proprotein convertase P-domain-containing protein, partial [Phycisphaerae bacterium]|nr:proprotein convertase P-domain-containing protein [Phycisphaerae bacterium]
MNGGSSAHEPVLEHLESRVLLSAQSQVDSALAAGWQDKPDEPGGGAADFLPAAYQGILPNGTAALHGATWYDADQDGIRDAGEPPLPDWTVYLDLNDNGLLDGSGTIHVPSTDVPKSIVDNTTTTSIAVVGGLVGQVRDVNVTLNITHTYCGDLDVFLIGPTGVSVELFTDVGGSGNNFTNTTLDDEAADSITAGTAPFTGSFRPEGLLSGFDGLAANGTWTLSVTDDAGADQGTLNSWSLTIETGEPTAVTAGDGSYGFAGLDAGTYAVREVSQPGWTRTFPADAHRVPLADGQVVAGLDFGNYAAPGRIEGGKWYDGDRDGVWDANEPPLAGWKIYLDVNEDGQWNDGEPFDITGADGRYALENVPPTRQLVREVLQDGWTQSFPRAGGGAGGSAFYAWNSETDGLFTIDADGSITDLPPAGAGADDIGGLAYDSLDGILYGLEAGGDLFRFDLPTGAATALGNVGMSFSFALAYNPLDDLLYSVTALGELVQIDPDALTAAIVSGPGPSTGSGGMEFFPDDGRIYCHSNGSTRMYSYDAVTFAGPTTHADPTQMSNYGMAYDGTSLLLAPGGGDTLYTYDPATGETTAVFPAGTLGGRGLNALTGMGGGGGHAVVVSPGQTAAGVDFGNHTETQIDGTKWLDADSDGVRDPEEPGLGGWRIYVDANGDGEWTDDEPFDVTDADGNYSLYVLPGTLTVREEARAGWTQTYPADAHVVTVDLGQQVAGVDFGNHAPTRIRGSKWQDLDLDGLWDAGEPPLAGWKIYVDANRDGEWTDGEPFDITDQDGNYEIDGLLPGEHIVAEVPQAGWTQSFPGGSPAAASTTQAARDLLLAALTTTGSKAPMYAATVGLGARPDGEAPQGELTPYTDISGPLIGMDQFRSDPRFAGIDGSGFSVVILDTGIDLNHPFFGPDA